MVVSDINFTYILVIDSLDLNDTQKQFKTV